jgi:hypothetical protein
MSCLTGAIIMVQPCMYDVPLVITVLQEKKKLYIVSPKLRLIFNMNLVEVRGKKHFTLLSMQARLTFQCIA